MNNSFPKTFFFHWSKNKNQIDKHPIFQVVISLLTVYKLVSEMKAVLQVILSDKNNNIQGIFRHFQAKRLSKQEK